MQLSLMNKNIVTPNNKWENYQAMQPGGSLIVGTRTNTHLLGPLKKGNPKQKLDDLHKQLILARHSTQEQIRPSNIRVNKYPPPYPPPQLKQYQRQQDPSYDLPTEKGINWERLVLLRKHGSKDHKKEPDDFKLRNSGGRAGNKLKETASTSTTQPLSSYKSQKTIPSFLRTQIKTLEKTKQEKKILSRDNFKILKRLGEGKFGIVNLACQINTGMIVALKVMQKKKIVYNNLLIQFIRELKIQAYLDHPSIIKTFGFFSDQKYFYTILQLGSDGELYDIISAGKTLSQESSSFIIGNLLDAVSHMHKHKIIHRDIKPQNIVLIHGNVKLCDFGWAVNKKDELRATYCGTPLYLSPQLLQGDRYDQKVDVWAIGVLAYQLVLGCSPFNIIQQQDLVNIINQEIYFPPHQKMSKQFKSFIKTILRKNPKERLPCKDLLNYQFIKKYKNLETCQELCQ